MSKAQTREAEYVPAGQEHPRERLRRLAWLLDSSIPVPGTRMTIGLDALIGLVPVLGDLVGVMLSSYIVAEAARMGAGRAVLARMALNVAVEGVAGMVPVAGDVFDAFFKANQRNVRLLEAWADRPQRVERGSLALVAGLVAGIVAVGVLGAAALILLARWLLGAFP